MDPDSLASIAVELSAVLGAPVLSDLDMTERYRTDWTGRFGGFAALVARPRTAEQVARVLRCCRRKSVPVVVQGGNTGLVGGSVPAGDGWVILSTERLDEVREFDADAGFVTVGAGLTLGRLSEYLRGSGWRFGVDLGARDSATLGGMVATNAGGMWAFRFGSTRAQVVGIEYAVTDGTVVSRLGGLIKDNTGYDLGAVLCGSEGTLAAVTAVRLRLIADPAFRTTALVGFVTMEAAIAAAGELRRACPDLEVIELIGADCLHLVADQSDASLPQWVGALPREGGATLFLEAAADTDPTPGLARALTVTAAGVDVAVAVTEAQRADLWELRDRISGCLAQLGEVVKVDVAVATASLTRLIRGAGKLVAAADGARLWIFGHVCDGNLHLNVSLPGEPDGAACGAGARSIESGLLRLVAELGGSISAEHGIGRLKADHLHLARTPREISLIRGIKAVFDPSGVMNPGVILGGRATPSGTPTRP